MADKGAAATSPAPDAGQDGSKPSATPIFGSGSAFGAGTGFAGFTGVDTSKTAAPAATTGEGEEEEAAAEEEECQVEFKPVVQLAEVEVTTGEESENTLLEYKCKLYRFDHEASEWKERGVGTVKLLENKENKRIRLLMRQEKTLKIRANHLIMPGTKLQEHSGSDKACVWSTVDFATGEQKMELFCIRFASVERVAEFRKAFGEAMATNEKLLAEEEGEPQESEAAAAKKEGDKAADDLAQGVEKVSVADK